MPIYTYRCEGCGETFDRRQSFSDAALTTHETCGGDLRKVLYPAGIVFKGSGFYNTDYKNGSAPAKSENGAASDGAAASTNGASDSKTESAASTASTDSASSAGSTGPAKSEPAKSGAAS